MTRHLLRAAILTGLVAAAACKGPVVQSPLTGQTRYLCCNLRYEKPVITDNPYQVGTLIPLGTPVEILEVRTDSVKFRAAGHPDITIVEKFGRKELPFDQFVSRIFVERDPRTQISRTSASRARGKRRGQAQPVASRLQEVEKGARRAGDDAPGGAHGARLPAGQQDAVARSRRVALLEEPLGPVHGRLRGRPRGEDRRLDIAGHLRGEPADLASIPLDMRVRRSTARSTPSRVGFRPAPRGRTASSRHGPARPASCSRAGSSRSWPIGGARRRRAARVIATEFPAFVSVAAMGIEQSEKYAAVIARFGRFPHRNQVLGRISTAEEEAFLADWTGKAPPRAMARGD